MAGAASEALVVGGGPAGATAAALLARWGHAVTLLARPAALTPDLGESIPPSTGKLLDVIGVRGAIDRARFVRSTGNTVWWGNDTPRIELFAGDRLGWQVTSQAFADILLEHARGAGVDVRIGRADLAAVTGSRAGFVLECTGRAGLLTRARGLREYDSRYRTVAMVGVWRCAQGFDVADSSHTLIESYDAGWAWSVPRSPHERFVAVMVDPRRLSGKGRPAGAAAPASAECTKPGRARYREQLSRTREMARIIADATLTTEPAGWDASMYRATRYVDGNVLLVGDAASFLDPLSSAGIKKALASGWLAAIAVHTALVRPAMRDTALAFFAAREAEVYAAFRAMTGEMFSEAAAWHAHPFWTDRSDEASSSADRPAIEEAFERLRRSASFQVTRSVEVRVEPRPAVRDNEIVLEPRLVSGDEDAGVRYTFGVDLLALIDMAPAYASVPELFAAYHQRHGPVALPDVLGALATALARKWLVWL